MSPRPELEEIPGANGAKVTIEPAPEGGYRLVGPDGVWLARHASARWLSDSALLVSGAREVRWAPGVPWD